ncbi:MAG: phage tail protein [Clostridia bacterium]|nr:phage tail protein [Clostridia bacterium]
MILYFADRQMRIQGQASTSLPRGFKVIEDLKTEEIETGVATFSCRIAFDNASRLELKNMTAAGNYLLRSSDGENEFYTIIDREIDTKNKEVYIYAEDAGLDLINEIVGEFEADTEHPADWYINKYIADSGFEIGLNEIPATSKRKLAWDGESTVTARLASIATQFGGFEISYSYDIKGLEITHKYVNIHEKRGQDNGVTLRLNSEIDKIVTAESVANLATAFLCEGGVPDNEETAITFSNQGYKYDDGDFFVDGDKLKSRKANEKWSRYVWNKEPNKLDEGGGYIVKPYSYNTTDPAELCSRAITELKKVCDVEVNYEIDVKRLPEGVKIGDRINIVDDAGEMYVSSRILKLEKSVVDRESTFTLGDHLIKTSGISQKVTDLAAQFAETSQSAARALAAANAVKASAEEANAKAEAAESAVAQAQEKAEEAKAAAESATQSAENAAAEALAAQAAVEKVESSVSSMGTTIENARQAAQDAEKAAEDATTLANEAKQAAQNVVEDVADAKSAAEAAQNAAESATERANEAETDANDAKTLADAASATAQAAKLDAEQAQKDVDAWGQSLETKISTMSDSYARKTDLTETKADLQSQIKRNAGLLSSTITGRTVIDETANNAATLAEKAQAKAQKAQELATEAAQDATEAQTAADEAAQAAADAQEEADTAQAAADAAQSILEQAAEALEAAKEDLATISGRADATEAEIAAAEKAVEDAQTAADEAQANATAAIETANNAKATADAAAKTAAEAQDVAALAALNAKNAQALSNDMAAAYEAQKTADDAVSAAEEAQETANTAVNNAKAAQEKADQAVADAKAADDAAKAAAATVANAQNALNTAKQNLANVLADVDATETEIESARAAVAQAQTAVDAAIAAAAEASGEAAVAAKFAASAQAVADEAQAAADKAQTAADEAQGAADAAQDNVDLLDVRVSTSESIIQQLSNAISMLVTDENGTTLLEQISTGWTFNLKGTADAVSSLQTDLDNLQESTGSTQLTVEYLRNAINDHNRTLGYVTISYYLPDLKMLYNEEKHGPINGHKNEPCIVLGVPENDFKLLITNTQIMFMNGSNAPTHINTNGLVTQDIVVEGEIVQGGYVMLNTSDGGWGLLWKGVSN